MSVKQFCKEQGLTEYSFHAWRKRLREQGPVRFAWAERSTRQQEHTAEAALELVLATGERLRIGNGVDTATVWAFLVSLISTHPPDGALSRTSLGPRPRCQRSSASIASGCHDQCARARNIFILRCGTKDHVLLLPQSRHRINSGRSPCRRIASENRGA
jgi:hypothetical protein